MKKIITILLRFLSIFSAKQVTAEEVLTCVPTDWICTIHGRASLRKAVSQKYGLGENELGDGEFYHLLKILEVRGLIELETRQWQNPIDKNYYLHQQCRKARAIKPNLPERSADAPGLATA